MTTFIWRADRPVLSLTAFHMAIAELNDGKPPKISIESFKALKVDGLWVITITYK